MKKGIILWGNMAISLIFQLNSVPLNSNHFHEDLRNVPIKVTVWMRMPYYGGWDGPRVKLEKGEYVNVQENWTEVTRTGTIDRMPGIYLDKEAESDKYYDPERLDDIQLYYGLCRIEKL